VEDMHIQLKGTDTAKPNQNSLIHAVRDSVRKSITILANQPPDWISKNGSNPFLSALRPSELIKSP